MSINLNFTKSIVETTLIYWLLATGTMSVFEFNGVVVFIHTILIFLYLLYFLNSKVNLMRMFEGIVFFAPFFCFIALSILQSNHYYYAWEKIEGGILASIIISILVFSQINKQGELRFLKNIFSIILVALVITIAYRVFIGLPLNGREGRYLINGPITFGWIMGLGAIIGNSIFLKTGKLHYIGLSFGCLFFMIGTNSKGPTLAFLFAFMVFVISNFRKNKRVRFIVLLYLIMSFPIFILLGDHAIDRFQALNYFSDKHNAESLGTYSVRITAYIESWKMIQSDPIFGIGIGNWNDISAIKILYPHNYIFEVASELGIVALLIFLIQIAVLSKYSGNIGLIILAFFLVALFFSGDLSYYRYLFGIPLGLSMYNFHVRKQSS